jgi:2-oxoglutarate ferredoxin oxidoreductase subunit alpha
MLEKHTEVLESVAIRFAGDSGDGMQLTGTQFTETTALAGNDLATFPDYPAEIRAPAGSLAGVSGFQVHFSSREVHTPGDEPDVLVAMNPAALKANLADLKRGGILIANTEQFGVKNLERAGYTANPLEDGSLSAYRVFPVDITNITLRAIADVGLNQRAAVRTKNFFALGLVYWLFSRELTHTEQWIRNSMAAKDPLAAEANLKALRAGWNFGDTTEMFAQRYEVPKARIAPGRYKNITGNEATGARFPGGGRTVRPRPLPGQLPDHPRVRHSALALEAEAPRRAHVPGGGRDRGHRCNHRCRLRGRPRAHDDERPGHRPEVRGDEPRDDARTAPGHL